MENEDPKVKKAVEGRWLRLLFIILFLIAFHLTETVLYIVLTVQFLLRLLVGRVNSRLQTLGRMLGAYAAEIIEFLTYASDRLPFPFSPWPRLPERPDKTG